MMLRDKVTPEILSEFMQYLATKAPYQSDQLPALSDLSVELGISVASLREQLEVARALDLVEVRPRTGIRRLPYSFRKTVRQSLAYALALGPEYFQLFSDFRQHIEVAYWEEAATKLQPEDLTNLYNLLDRAEEKLHGQPVQIPQTEHRELHLTIYKRLENPFVTGVLEVYWEMYEAVGLNVYADYDYLEKVWQYHRWIVDAISDGELKKGEQLLVEHLHLISQRPEPLPVFRPDGFVKEGKKE